jgi:hypothetical protein
MIAQYLGRVEFEGNSVKEGSLAIFPIYYKNNIKYSITNKLSFI